MRQAGQPRPELFRYIHRVVLRVQHDHRGRTLPEAVRAGLKAAALLNLLAVVAPLGADAWPRGRKAVVVYLRAAGANADQAFDPDGERIPFPGRGVRQRRASAYIEVGLSDTATLVVSAPYERVTFRGMFNDFTTSGGGDLDLRIRLSLEDCLSRTGPRDPGYSPCPKQKTEAAFPIHRPFLVIRTCQPSAESPI